MQAERWVERRYIGMAESWVCKHALHIYVLNWSSNITKGASREGWMEANAKAYCVCELCHTVWAHFDKSNMSIHEDHNKCILIK